MKLFLFFIYSFLSFSTHAQTTYWVSYKSKSDTKYSLEKPEAFLSEKALARRQKYQIPIHTTDLPVCKLYTKSIQNIGVEVSKSSKWLNGSLIYIKDEAKVAQIKQFSFVKSIQKLTSNSATVPLSKFNEITTPVNSKTDGFNYGEAANQIEIINGEYLHNSGFTGSGTEIAIMDNGFTNVNSNIFYQKAYSQGRIIPGYNFIDDNDTLFGNSNGSHGNLVISTMVSENNSVLVGTAPDASYYLFMTEDNANEGLQEEYNWAMAAEMADSMMGERAIISTSLGYSNGFNNSADEHTYSDMDGNTTPITIAADLAAAKGFLVINSAGNEGDKTWKFITAPSDGDSVLCVGAVDKDRLVADFSSRGPSFDGRVKPNVCAQGLGVYGVNPNGQVVSINGTSFSCPITSGMAACLWQAFPEKSNMEIFELIEQSAHLYNNPDNDYGYGIPNFNEIFRSLRNDFESNLLIFPNPISDKLSFYTPKVFENKIIRLKITNIDGHIVANESFMATTRVKEIIFSKGLSKGLYFLELKSDEINYKSKFVKK